MIVFSVAGLCGLFMFDTKESLEFPIAQGDQMGLYLNDSWQSLSSIIELEETEQIFQPYKKQSISTAQQNQRQLWLRLPLENHSSEERSYILQVDGQRMDLVQLSIVRPDSSVENWRSGEKISQNQRLLNIGRNAFPIHLAPGSQQTYYLLLRDRDWLNTSISLWPNEQEYFNQAEFEYRFLFVYLGLLAGLFLTNLSVYLVFRYRDLSYYLLYLASILLLQIVNFQLYKPLAYFFFADELLVDLYATSYFNFAGVLSLSAGLLILFSASFLKISRIAPRLHQSLKILSAIFILIAPVIMLGPGQLLFKNINYLIVAIWFISHLTALAIGIYAAFKSSPEAKYFIPALLLLFIVSWRFNQATLADNVVPYEVTMQWLYASCLEMLIFTYGLVERFLHINQEKEKAQEKALLESQNFAQLNLKYRKELTREVGERTAELNEANDQKEELLRILAHDLKSPIDGVGKLAELLSKNTHIPPEQVVNYAKQIRQSTTQLSELTRNVLDWSKISTTPDDLQIQPYLVRDLFDSALAMMQLQALIKDVQIFSHTTEQHYVSCDFNLITSVLRNLLSNAIKYSEAQQSIHLTAVPLADSTRIVVSDEGCGISPESLDEIQQKGSIESTPGTQHEKGMGFGLQICRSALSSHHTQLSIQSTPGRGTRCSFTLPSWTPNS